MTKKEALVVTEMSRLRFTSLDMTETLDCFVPRNDGAVLEWKIMDKRQQKNPSTVGTAMDQDWEGHPHTNCGYYDPV